MVYFIQILFIVFIFVFYESEYTWGSLKGDINKFTLKHSSFKLDLFLNKLHLFAEKLAWLLREEIDVMVCKYMRKFFICVSTYCCKILPQGSLFHWCIYSVVIWCSSLSYLFASYKTMLLLFIIGIIVKPSVKVYLPVFLFMFS